MGALDIPGVSPAQIKSFEATLYYNTSTTSYPTRPSTTDAPVVMWVGPSPPNIGSGAAVNGDFWRRTA